MLYESILQSLRELLHACQSTLNFPAKVSLTVYYRVGCHLCEHMTASLRSLQSELDFDIELIDIDKDEILREKYNVDVPVVACGGEVVCYHFFEEEMVRESIEIYNKKWLK